MSDDLTTGNLLERIPNPAPEESVTELLSRPGARIERIVSHGHGSPAGFWYDQPDDEWVAVIEGEADLEIHGEKAPRRLSRGAWVFLPAHCRHRVARTAADRPTVWLAVHVTARR